MSWWAIVPVLYLLLGCVTLTFEYYLDAKEKGAKGKPWVREYDVEGSDFYFVLLWPDARAELQRGHTMTTPAVTPNPHVIGKLTQCESPQPDRSAGTDRSGLPAQTVRCGDEEPETKGDASSWTCVLYKGHLGDHAAANGITTWPQDDEEDDQA